MLRSVKVKIVALLLLSFVLTEIRAQETIPASGGTVYSDVGSVSLTIGQVVYISNTGPNDNVEQGIQHAYDNLLRPGNGAVPSNSMQCSVSPNPTADYIRLHIENLKSELLTFQLYELNGKLIMTQKIAGTDTSISLKNIPPATYLLSVINDNKSSLKVFKIVKY